MKRFRFTLLAFCVVLLFLGYTDLKTLFANPEPAVVDIATLEKGAAPRAWLTVTGGYWNLEQAISTTGTIELEAFLVPLRSSADPNADIRVVVETRDPEVVELLKKYYFSFDSLEEQAAFREQNREAFFGQHDITGMLMSGLIESANRDKLLKLAHELNMPIKDDVIMLSAGKEPEQFRGYFFAIIALLGMLKFGHMIYKGRKTPAALEEIKLAAEDK